MRVKHPKSLQTGCAEQTIGLRCCFRWYPLLQFIIPLFRYFNTFRGGSRGAVEGVATPPLSSFFLLLLFCLILPKNNRIKLFLRSYFTFTIRLLVKLWKDNVHFAKVVSGSGILKQATWTGDIHWKVNEGDWDRPNAWVSLKWVQRLTENEENNRLLCKEIR